MRVSVNQIFKGLDISTKRVEELFLNTIQFIRKITQFLEGFGNLDLNSEKTNLRRLNLEKVKIQLNMPESCIKEYVNLILDLQNKFNSQFKDVWLYVKELEGKKYLAVRKKLNFTIPERINLNSSDANLLNDLAYIYLAKGVVINLLKNKNTEILEKVNGLFEKFPFLFKNENSDSLYFSEFGLRLGKEIQTYTKLNKSLKEIKINGCSIVFSEKES